uniref:Uncharacterized protein n=1 Tax=viral metagenome TaxID=1070528 RepID=A0A6C0HS97_9ZZZZ
MDKKRGREEKNILYDILSDDEGNGDDDEGDSDKLAKKKEIQQIKIF